ncbi:urocanate hydratase [Myxococcota bacterium]|nr:urocanate hydratase [Myxococcota bacterium]MBU1411226.1 urocanate hydratase [Myxococcota bacterium]MBU1512224.1 urocanate hydratase [Myxococcota bacterium]
MNPDFEFRKQVSEGLPEVLPEPPVMDPGISRAPARTLVLSPREKELALRNALRYFPAHQHAALAPEFARELEERGRIYMYRFRPAYKMHARPIDDYPARSRKAAAIMLMIQNNLDPAVAQHPYELITYGGNGAVFQNWAQYRLAMRYLCEMTDDQTLLMYSGHPMGLFPAAPGAPRVVVTNGMMIPHYSTTEDYDRYVSLGVTSYGQMTAGSYMYIGPQGIVHGTTITLLNAGRLYLDTEDTLAGKTFVTSGLGGMSGAQGKAALITRAACVIAEVNPRAAIKRRDQGWVQEISSDLEVVARRLEHARIAGEPLAMAYLGNVVDLWEYFARHDIPVDLGSDQTSLHLPYSGGYYPAGLGYDEANDRMVADPAGFRELVTASLVRHAAAIGELAGKGMRFWDYGNAFLLEASRAGAAVMAPDGGFLYPSYVENIMGPMCFDYGFGPFRWVVTSGRPEDLDTTDEIAAEVLVEQARTAPPEIRRQIADNLHWIRTARENRLVVGSQARILYADTEGRVAIARAFNEAIRAGRISAPVVLGRDHHDVSGTDSPYRETANIRDGSRFTADMAVQNVIGDAMRGATWVSLHNGGGTGWGESINGGFGMLIDGSDEARRALESMLFFDVANGIARRAWAGNDGARFAAARLQETQGLLRLTPVHECADPALLTSAFTKVDV